MFLYRLIRTFLPLLLLVLLAVFLWKKFRPESLFKSEEKVTVSHHTVLTKVEALGKMELVRYNFKDVVEYKKGIMFLPDSRSVLIVSGEAVGCIDLRKLTEQDLVFSGDSLLTVYLPKPEICYSKVNHEKSKILLMENTYFRDAELVDEAYKYAEKNIARTANHSGILRQTEANAHKILKPLLENSSGRKVIIRKQSEKMQVPTIQKR
ncbi:DUF4230 domain-containing protein [Adhaeribacter sp. BT258]|uniref:DUF4230 domain-containing protein n=1 Tax=Adhaeribacter terrigena TaxID=2793070 RepID=A0ABS1C6Z2_9BACT|nr:DUF4230 domain-containing protein [Adhaeribacter terrigena]MBK0404360.1 DUF4230 domain-containing protein [Adhaeribacter terrigena]